VNVATGLLSLLIGNTYLMLAWFTARDMWHHRHDRGYSHFGAAFLVMALTCGPHHVVHGVHLLVEGDVATGLVLASLLWSLPPGVIFVALRIEADRGGPGDRFVNGTPPWLFALPVVALLAYGALGYATVAYALEHGAPSAMAIPNVVLIVAYAVVGWTILRTQARRRTVTGGWSVSGLSLGAIFPTCAAMHAVHVVSSPFDIHGFTFDVVGVPAALYFLWAVRRLYRESLRDWNRRPLVGRAGSARRPAPWATAPAGAGR
jgi:hypothetical protein